MRRESKRKRLVYVPEDVLGDVTKVSRSRGESLGQFIEEALRQVVLASDVGYDPRQMAGLLKVIRAYRVLGGAFVPLDVLNHLVTVAYEGGREQLQAKWYESGRWHGKYLKETFENPVETFKTFLEETRWDLNEVEVKQEDDLVRVRCISTLLTIEGTELLGKYVEGVMHSIGYETEKSDHVKGMVVLEFKR